MHGCNLFWFMDLFSFANYGKVRGQAQLQNSWKRFSGSLEDISTRH